MRIGSGYDVHRLVAGRPLVLGGVNIPYEKGLLGHSDADVLTHAVCDAVLGALGLGDIGQHFPDTSEAYKGANSVSLLKTCRDLMKAHGYVLGNMDATVFAQAPKLAIYKDSMERCLAKALGAEVNQVNVKATTTEGLGSIGKGEGMAAECTILLMPEDSGSSVAKSSQ